jgi:hypothetical protein
LSPPIQFGRNPIVIGLKYLPHAGRDLSFAEPDISGNGCEFAHFDDRRLRARQPVAVDGEAGIILPYDYRTERVSDQAADRARANIPGNVTLAVSCLKTEHLETPWQMFPGVVADDDKRRSPALVGHCDGPRFIGREQAGRRVIHLGSLIRQKPSTLIRVVSVTSAKGA